MKRLSSVRRVGGSRRFFERLEDRRLLVSPWQNPLDPLDVNDSGTVSPIDVLLVVNDLNAAAREEPSMLESGAAAPPYLDTNGDLKCSPLDVLLIINALNAEQPAMTIAARLSPDSDPNGNGVVLKSPVTVEGLTEPWARISVTVTPETVTPEGETRFEAIADSMGRYSLPIEVSDGKSRVGITARSRFGETVAVERFIRRGDVVLDWNASLLNVIRDWTTSSNDPYENGIVTERPPVAARNLAMIHAAIYDAVNGIAQTHHPYRVDLPAPEGASTVAAAAAAAERVAAQLYQDAGERAIFTATLNEALATVPEGLAKSLGRQYGQQVGDAILALRVGDGAEQEVAYTPGTAAGQWQRTFPDYLPPLLPQWAQVDSFSGTPVSQFRPPAPPSLESAEYAAAVDEAMQLGGLNNSVRTAEQTEIALFWADGGGTSTPPGHWNQIAADIALSQGRTLEENARLLALLNIALADAGIAAWDAKYEYDLWRPIDAIRRADTDGNIATSPDPNWRPLLGTPPFPTYTSGHSTFSGAADAVLSDQFGANFAFSSQSDRHARFAPGPFETAPAVTREFSSFAEAADEAGMSRIYGGIHFGFDNTAGLTAGRALGTHIVETLARPREEIVEPSV